jgi:hypothetical protein
MLEDAGFTERLIAVDALANGDGMAELLKAAENWSDADEQNRRKYIEFEENSISACFDSIATSTKKAMSRR